MTIDYYSLLTPTTASTVTGTTPPFTQDIFATTAGIAAVTVLPEGETVYAETVVLTLDALVSGTSTYSTLLSTPTAFVCTLPSALFNCSTMCAVLIVTRYIPSRHIRRRCIALQRIADDHNRNAPVRTG